MLSSKICFRQLRALASLAPTVSQLDNTSDFLAHVPHRKHPGVINLKVVQLPKEAQDAAKVLLQGSTIRDLQGHVNSLNNFLWSRKRPAEDKDLRVRAEELEKKFRASVGCDAETESFEQQEKLRNRVLNTLRKNIYHWQPMSYTEELSLVYFAARFDGGYAAVTRALKEIHQRCPEFKPQTLLDFGSGTGSVTWAANNLWGKSLVEYMCVDSAAPMNRLSELVLKGGSESGEMHISGVYFRQFLPLSPKVQYDLVVSAFSLTDLPSLSEREKVVQALWRKTGGFLVLVESGTKEGHQLLMEARDIVLQKEDKEIWDHRPPQVFAPCPHQMPCPKLSNRLQMPCNFIQKYQPLPFNWNPHERWEKFSFIIISRGYVGGAYWPRIISHVLSRPRHVHCHMCCADGELKHEVITARRHGRDLYRCARNSEWGDRLPILTSTGTTKDEDSENEDMSPAL
ncbi:hypothetical protein XENTR_v10002154 [Xenopus tropicalis]|uniref:Ribosome assembly protein METTL17, mitochondrial n=1 Tax=Xenopus tropicalis TaxID=8364 RepID=B1WBI1_XENTR|nr:methyltransferase-like protein 17, mitochondrial [Xenopus tropicalis]AAI61764.1 LOC100145785 protein [Xenopus tropicalis]KAE8633930.1 hypothetical protein XENTR_v10002154 [Xenopus tropicalis]|eukprot:NP_001120620.1 methyltransferase-like protein 17, mitochondrial [Xenopus tropicalis]